MGCIVHMGYLLQEFVDNSKEYNTSKIGSVLGITRQTVYLMYGYKTFDKKTIEKLENAQINIPGVTTNVDTATKVWSNVTTDDAQRAEIDRLKTLLQGKDETITALTKALTRLQN